jgi:hypothetical protein
MVRVKRLTFGCPLFCQGEPSPVDKKREEKKEKEIKETIHFQPSGTWREGICSAFHSFQLLCFLSLDVTEKKRKSCHKKKKKKAAFVNAWGRREAMRKNGKHPCQLSEKLAIVFEPEKKKISCRTLFFLKKKIK